MSAVIITINTVCEHFFVMYTYDYWICRHDKQHIDSWFNETDIKMIMLLVANGLLYPDETVLLLEITRTV